VKATVYWAIGIVFVVGLIANLAMEYDTRGTHDLRPYFLRSVLVFTAAAPGWIGLYIGERRNRANERESQRRGRLDYLAKVLEGSVRKLFPDEDHYTIRANVMVVREEKLQVLCQWNTEAYPDSRMSLSQGQGVAGTVWKIAIEGNVADFWRPLYAPWAQLSRQKLTRKWRLGKGQIEATAQIRWILSTPILQRVGAETRFLGVLNLDGVIRDLKNMHIFEDETFHRHCVKAAEQVGNEIVMGDLLAI